MAAITPATLTEARVAANFDYVNPATGNGTVGNFGWNRTSGGVQSEKLRIFTFPSVDNGDTWAFGIQGVTRFAFYEWSETITVGVSQTASTFTFSTSAPDAIVILYVWAAT